MKPRCKAGQQLELDADGETDKCIHEHKDVADKPGDETKPLCRPGLELKARRGEDVCERIELPRCPPGFKLTPKSGRDVCIA